MSERWLLAEITALPDAADEVGQLLHRLTEDVRAEPGNLRFDPARREGSPGSFVVFEAYRDEDSFQAHLASAHCREFNERLEPLVEGGGSTLHWLVPHG